MHENDIYNWDSMSDEEYFNHDMEARNEWEMSHNRDKCDILTK